MDTLNPQIPLESTPEQQPPSAPPKPPFRPKTFLITSVVFIIIIVSLTTYLLSARTNPTSQPPPSPISPTLSQPSPTPFDETANWKTYTNTKVGFQMKYPPRYPKPILPSGLEAVVYADGTEDSTDIIFGETSDDSISLIVFPFSGTLDQLVDARKDNKTPVWLSGTPTILKREFQVNGIKVRWYTSMPPTVYPGDTVGRIEIYFIGIDHGFILYPNLDHDEKEIDQILSTFKFTK